MSDFAFDASKSFDQNLEAFLVDREAADPELAAILRANVDLLRTLVTHGERDAGARADFNAAIMKALDQLITTEAKGAV